jgi:histidinol-phosphate phosphatase family protein
VIAYSVVIPTVGRRSLLTLLRSLQASSGPRPERVVVVDDRPAAVEPVVGEVGGWLDDVLEVWHSNGGGPAAARNVGWRACSSEWIAFLDDDVVVGPSWAQDVAADLAAAGPRVAGSQARIHVPLPTTRRPTDWERGTAGLASARWITADMAYRRRALQEAGGFDERFPRAFREDADLALRVLDHGWALVVGRRCTTHPVRPASWRASLDQQRGNADDVLMARVHGRDWYARAGAPRGRRSRHLAITGVLLGAGVGAARGRFRIALAALVAWAGGTAEFAWARIAPGPRDRAEVGRMLATSVLIPPAATWHWLRGLVRHRRAQAWGPAVEAVLFDRDGTLVHDVPYNGSAELVRPVDGAREAVTRLRAAGLKLGVITNQSAVARGIVTTADVAHVNARLDELIGPFDTWQVCPHGDEDRCDCRKPRPGLVQAAARELGVSARHCVVVGDTAADLGAGAAAGAASLLVPNDATLSDEVRAADWRAPDLRAAADAVLARLSRGRSR